MRTRAIIAALSGVLALSVLGAPAVHAAGSDMHNPPTYAVPPDPYVMHNPPMFAVPPDPYVMHNPPMYAVPPDPYYTG